MNLYFLLEGRRTEKRIYPAWLGHLLPKMGEVDNPNDLRSYNFYLLSSNGYPAYLESIPQAHEDIRQNPKVSHFFVCVDAEDMPVPDKLRELDEEIVQSEEKTSVRAGNAHFETHIIVQNCCIETWLLGNAKMMTTNPNSDRLVDCKRFFDIRLHDPELMGAPPSFATRAQFHEHYLRSMFDERNIVYSKRNPGDALKAHYVQALRERAAVGHIPSFRALVDAWSRIAERMV